MQIQANRAILRGMHETACVRSNLDSFGYTKVPITKKFYVYGSDEHKFVRKPRRINENIPLLMDTSGFRAENNAVACPSSFFQCFLLSFMYVIAKGHCLPVLL